MARYKLSLPEMIRTGDIPLLNDIRKYGDTEFEKYGGGSLGCGLFKNTYYIGNTSGLMYTNEAIREEWLEKVPDTAFDNYVNTTYGDTLTHREVAVAKTTWKAAQENRDLLYRDLVESVSNYAHDKTGFAAGMFRVQLQKIKVVLDVSE